MGKPVRRLIVGHYQRNLEWLDQVPAGWSKEVVKNGEDRPNQGREPGMFFWWIIKNYEKIKPNDQLVFVQDFPFDHFPEILAYLEHDVVNFELLGHGYFEAYGRGEPHDTIPLKECYERWLNKEWPGMVKFKPGGQFAALGLDLLRYNKDFYKYMEEEVGKDRNCWAMERLWLSLFGYGLTKDYAVQHFCYL